MVKQTAKPVEEATPAAGEDNNKHLAFLVAQEDSAKAHLASVGCVDLAGHSPIEALIKRAASLEEGNKALHSGVDHLALAIAAAGIELTDGQDPILQAIAIVEDFRARAANMAEAIVAGEHELNEGETPFVAALRILSKPPGDATDGEIAAIARAEKAEARVSELEVLIETGRVGGDCAANPELPPAKRHVAAECGPIGQRSTAAELHTFLEDGPLELVFSDGENEIFEFEPVTLAVADLYRHGNRLMVMPPIEITGPRGADAVPIEIEGVALLVNGEQVDYCPLESKLTINPGDCRRFSRAFTFGAG